MCGRFTISTKKERIETAFPDIRADDWRPPRYNIAPTQDVPVVRAAMPLRVEWLHWGLVPAWSRDSAGASRLVNARSDGVATKPSFRGAFANQRCLILADGFYEWDRDPSFRTKQPYLFRLADGAPFAFAGLWDTWNDPADGTLTTCCIITTEANEVVRTIHDRMPVILPSSRIPEWLDPATPRARLQSLLAPYPAERMTRTPVSSRVNRIAHDGPDCTEPVTPPPSQPTLFPSA